MPKIIRAIVTSESKDEKNHMVKITSEGWFKDLLVESVNGLYLRKDDVVFVYIDDAYLSPLILGRATGQLELTQLVQVLNDIIDKQKEIIDTLTNHKSKYDVHTHGSLTGTFEGTIGGAAATGTIIGSMASPTPEQHMGDSPKKLENIEEDDLLKEQ